MSLDFVKYVTKGVIGELSAVALYTSGANWKMKSGNLYQVTLSHKPFEAPASCAWVHFEDTWSSDETWCKVKKQCVKSWYSWPRRGPPTQPWAANRPRAAARLRAATRPPVTCSPPAKTGPPVAIQNLFVSVAAPNTWTNSKVKIFLFWEEYSHLERITLDPPFQRK